VRQIVLAGGVAANSGLREEMKNRIKEELGDVDLVIPPLSLCGDNAAMIGAAAAIEFSEDEYEFTDMALNAKPGLTL